MTHTIETERGRYNFHNAGPITIRYTADQVRPGRDGQAWNGPDGQLVIVLSPHQAKRILDHYCSRRTLCHCGSRPTTMKAYGYDSNTGQEVWGIGLATDTLPLSAVGGHQSAAQGANPGHEGEG